MTTVASEGRLEAAGEQLDYPPWLQKFLQDHKSYFSRIPETGKIKCHLNGHEFAPNLATLTTFVSGKKFYQLRTQKEGDDWMQNCKEFLQPSKNFKGKLYCRLTGSLIDCNARMTAKHMEGKKFKKRKAKLEEHGSSFKFTEEPNISDIEREFLSASEGDGDEEQSLPAASDISKLSSQFASRKNGLQNDHHPGMEMEEDVAKETCGLSEKRDVHFGRKRQVPEVTNPAWKMKGAKKKAKLRRQAE